MDENRTPPTLETQRLVLRPFELSDTADVPRLAGDRAIAEMTLAIPLLRGPGNLRAAPFGRPPLNGGRPSHVQERGIVFSFPSR